MFPQFRNDTVSTIYDISIAGNCYLFMKAQYVCEDSTPDALLLTEISLNNIAIRTRLTTYIRINDKYRMQYHIQVRTLTAGKLHRC